MINVNDYYSPRIKIWPNNKYNKYMSLSFMLVIFNCGHTICYGFLVALLNTMVDYCTRFIENDFINLNSKYIELYMVNWYKSISLI